MEPITLGLGAGLVVGVITSGVLLRALLSTRRTLSHYDGIDDAEVHRRQLRGSAEEYARRVDDLQKTAAVLKEEQAVRVAEIDTVRAQIVALRAHAHDWSDIIELQRTIAELQERLEDTRAQVDGWTEIVDLQREIVQLRVELSVVDESRDVRGGGLRNEERAEAHHHRALE